MTDAARHSQNEIDSQSSEQPLTVGSGDEFGWTVSTRSVISCKLKDYFASEWNNVTQSLVFARANSTTLRKAWDSFTGGSTGIRTTIIDPESQYAILLFWRSKVP